MSNHNFCFDTGYEIIDENGKVVKSEMSNVESNVEGEICITAKDENGKEYYKQSQPMKSFVAQFLQYCVGYGRRFINTKNLTGYNGVRSVGTSDTPVKMNQTSLSEPNYQSFGSTENSFVFDSFNVYDEYVEINVSKQTIINASSGSTILKEIGFTCSISDPPYNALIARDVLENSLTVSLNTNLRLEWTFRFPKSVNSIITKNWLNNIIHDISGSMSDYKDKNGNIRSGVDMASGYYDTFLRLGNCNCPSNDDTYGILIGSSDSDCSIYDYTIGNPISKSILKPSTMTLNYSTPVIINNNTAAYITCSREFQNISGMSVNVKEAGIFAKEISSGSTQTGISNAGTYMISRWHTGNIEVPANHTLRVYWQPKVTC